MFSASIKNEGDSKYHVVTKNYTFDISTDSQGAHPIETVLAGLCGCMGHFTRDYLQTEDITGGEFSVTAESDILEDGPRLSAITITINIKDIALDDGQKKDLLQFIRRCPVYNTLKANSEIKVILRSS